MSRYELAPKQPNTFVVVGWDGPLRTFFAQVDTVPESADDDPEKLLWIGTDMAEIETAGELQDLIREYADIPPEIMSALRNDVDEWLAQNVKLTRLSP